jgi:hypothetical protein
MAPLERRTRCPRGTTVPPKKPSWTLSARPPKTGGAKFVPPEERIATFDQDGTLWLEHPIYSQVVYCLDRVPALVKEKPELKNIEPVKTVLSGDLEAIAKLPLPELEKIVVATLTEMTTEQLRLAYRADERGFHRGRDSVEDGEARPSPLA